MNIRMWGISLFMFLSTVSAVGQTANRYLKAPLLLNGRRVDKYFNRCFLWMIIGGNLSETPSWIL